MIKLDNIDLQILNVLQKNGEISYKACLNYVSATKWNLKNGWTGLDWSSLLAL